MSDLTAQRSLLATTPGLGASNFHPIRAGSNLVQDLFRSLLGIETPWLVNASICVAALSAAWQWVNYTLYSTVREYITSTVMIESNDPLYEIVLRYIIETKLPVQKSKAARVVTLKTTTLEDDEKALDLLEKQTGRDNLLNYRAMIRRAPIEFQYQSINHFFRHGGSFFWFRHHREDSMSQARRGPQMYNDDMVTDYCRLEFECFGTSTEPIKRLILDAQAHDLAKPGSTVRIAKPMLHPNNFVTRPARNIDTVILDEEKKSALLADINEYLHPRTRRWYTEHGIPYRRGYLFSGHPGTGKSSLSASIAGLFGLPLYSVSLLEAIDDFALSNFFNNLQSRCIVLMEDIDAAGLNRDDDEMPQSNDPYPFYGRRQRGQSSEVTLSGLLNALDGVGSQEGRIIIMTTNYPDKLDEALIRPGRVDMHIRFNLPRKTEIHDLYSSMYKTLTEEFHITGAKEHERLTTDQLEDLSRRFSDTLPESTLSHAMIQGYLLKYKNAPREAVEGAAAWVEEALEEIKRAEEKEKLQQLRAAKKTALAKAKAKIEQAKAEAQAKQELERLEKEEQQRSEQPQSPNGKQDDISGGNSESGASNSEPQEQIASSASDFLNVGVESPVRGNDPEPQRLFS